MTTSDPFLFLLKKEAKIHFSACLGAFLVLTASRYAGVRGAGADAFLLTPSPIGLVADFLLAVLMLTFFRVLYGVPLWFTRPGIQKVGRYVLFSLVFGTLFTLRTQRCIGAQIEDGHVRLFFPYPHSSEVVSISKLGTPVLRGTSAVLFIELPEPPTEFVPAFRIDAVGQSKLLALFDALKTARSGDRR